MHPTAERLAKAAKELKGKVRPVEIGRLINESEQTISNWKARGVPSAKFVDIAVALGCRPEWLAHGHGSMTEITGYLSASESGSDGLIASIANRAQQSTPPGQYTHPDKTIAQIVALLENTDDVGRGAALLSVIDALGKVRPVKESA